MLSKLRTVEHFGINPSMIEKFKRKRLEGEPMYNGSIIRATVNRERFSSGPNYQYITNFRFELKK